MRLRALAFMALVFIPVVAQADEGVCQRFIDSNRELALNVIRDTSKDFKETHAELSVIFEKTVDIDWLAEKSAGSYWHKAAEKFRAPYLKSYRSYLTRYYLGSMDQSDLAGITDITLSELKPVEDNIYHVRLRISQKGEDPVDADLHLVEEPAGICHIRDFAIEGVSMLASQSEEIQNLGKIGGLKVITQKLNDYQKPAKAAEH